MEGQPVQLFVTCLVDALAPEVGRATVRVLEDAGCEVAFPEGQSCCGQPAFNVGMHDEARRMAKATIEVLDATEGPIIVPSGSCAEMIVHHYPRLLAGTGREAAAERVAGRARELTQYLVDDLGAGGGGPCGGCRVAYHHSCHGLRGLGLDGQADVLLEEMDRVPYAADTECCGFGGLFSVEMGPVSSAIMDEKLDALEATGADTLAGGDVSCLLHMEGGLRRRGSSIEVVHIAELLDRGRG